VSDDKRLTRTRAANRASLRNDNRLSAPGMLQQGEDVAVGGILTAELPASASCGRY
jgi:hypothetical protein